MTRYLSTADGYRDPDEEPKMTITTDYDRWAYPSVLAYLREPTDEHLDDVNGATHAPWVLDVLRLTGVELERCGDCADITRAEDAMYVGGDGNDRFVCSSCREDYALCEVCEYMCPEDETHLVQAGWPRRDKRMCETCLSDWGYVKCCHCSMWSEEWSSVHDEPYCEDCCSDLFTWCDECEEYVNPDDSYHNHDGCDCEAPVQRFTMPANGAGTVREDERTTVKLPAGTVDAEGMRAITVVLAYGIGGDEGIGYAAAEKAIASVGPEWTARRGNMTKRLSAWCHRELGVKLSPALISHIGNVARAHSAGGDEHEIAFTRNLNMNAGSYAHGGSCLWGSYYATRCAIKSWGGMALRAFSAEGRCIGRAWVQPVTAEMEPTHNTINPAGYVVWNRYGTLDSFTAVRIVAHLAGLTYCRVDLSLEDDGDGDTYVNGDVGYLVSDAATCAATSEIAWCYDVHDNRDAAKMGVPQ